MLLLLLLLVVVVVLFLLLVKLVLLVLVLAGGGTGALPTLHAISARRSASASFLPAASPKSLATMGTTKRV